MGGYGWWYLLGSFLLCWAYFGHERPLQLLRDQQMLDSAAEKAEKENSKDLKAVGFTDNSRNEFLKSNAYNAFNSDLEDNPSHLLKSIGGQNNEMDDTNPPF